VKDVEVRPNRINLDTGAYATGRLACLVLDGDSVAFI
jgi:serine/threonine protein phosphatase 1